MNLWILLLLILGGCVSGLLAGLLGFGGGMLFMLIFANYLTLIKVPDAVMPELILANSMFAMFIAGISGSFKHYLNQNFYIKPVLIIGVTSSLCAALVTHFVIHSRWYNKDVFTIIFVVVVLYTALKIFLIDIKRNDPSLVEGFSTNTFFLIGCAGGSLSALAGVGGGIVMVPMLTKLLHIDIKKATAISLGVITLTSLTTSIYSLAAASPIFIEHGYGLIVFPMVLPVSLGCLICSPIGVALSKKLTSQRIRLLYLLFLTIAVTNMVYSMWFR
jgi:uncharacterized membrane protein YfcA